MNENVAGVVGAKPKPSWPRTCVVTPCRRPASWTGARSSSTSEWTCTSIRPGATTAPATSRRRAAAAPPRSPTDAMRSLDTPTSAANGGPPLPSTTSPPDRIRSSGVSDLVGRREHLGDALDEQIDVLRRQRVPAHVGEHELAIVQALGDRAESRRVLGLAHREGAGAALARPLVERIAVDRVHVAGLQRQVLRGHGADELLAR